MRPLSPKPVPELPVPSGLSQSVRGSACPCHPSSSRFPRLPPHPVFRLLCGDIRSCLVSLFPTRLYPPGDRALLVSPASALHLAQSGCSLAVCGVKKRT